MKEEKIFRAGMILYYIDENKNIQMLFMIPSNTKYGGDKFQIPKGKLDLDETPLETAKREAFEEVGWFIFNNDGEPHHLGRFLGRTDFYVTKIKDINLFGDFHHETKEIKWLTPNEFYIIGRDLHVPVVKAAERYIKAREGME
jgi:8-oxo-dGTP pyrophosphatase MutT (NUDIX family)